MSRSLPRSSESRLTAVIPVAVAALALLAPAIPVLARVAAKAAPVSADEEPADRAKRLAAEFQAGVDLVAGDAMEGRGLGSKGIKRAADWIESRLRSNGFEPAFGKSYRQTFQVKTGVSTLPGNKLEGVGEGDWTPLGFSSSGEFSGELAFVGYGIDSPSLGYREYEGIDLRGKVALMLRYEPQEKDEASPFDGRNPSRWSALRYKVLQARERGAVAVVFATGPVQDEGTDKIPALKNDGPESPAGLPVLQVRTSIAQKWLSPLGVDLRKFQEEVDRDLIPRSAGSTGIRVSGKVSLKQEYSNADNVVGVLPGRGPLAGEVVVVGAHYDHLGMGGERSMKPNVSAIHNGADDNASGTVSAILIGQEVGRTLAATPSRRTLVLALFAAEEVGLGGSAAFVNKPPFPVDRIAAMFNLDMVGQLRDDLLIVYGTESAKEWSEEVAKAAAAVPGGLKLTSKGDGYGPSDQTSFYASGVPVLYFFTGQHDRYHTPDDDPSTLNAAGASKVIEFASTIAGDTLVAEKRPTYQKTSGAPSMEGDSRGYGAYLGTVPDFRAMEGSEGGVLLSDVRAGGPADLAGIKGGDKIVEMAGTKIENLHDMTYALQDHKPGDTITVVVIRGGERVALKATLGDRAAMGKTSKAAGSQAETKEAAKSPAPVPSPTPAPAAPAASAATALSGGLSAFYKSRPGPDFVTVAGKPFEKVFEGEKHLMDIRQLTFGGENAEAYFSPDGRKLIFQWTRPEGGCDQQYVMDLTTGGVQLVSSGKGRTTCGYFRWPQGNRIVYASTQGGGDDCPPAPDQSKGYVWALYDTYDLWEANPDGSDAKRITSTAGYDAEATWCHRGGKFVFTSMRDGDLDLYEMDEAGTVKRLTKDVGYDGGAFYSPDCSEIVWRASRPVGKDLDEYKVLLAEGLIRPRNTEIFVAKADGSNAKQLTANGGANFCPYFTADGKKIIFTSNFRGGRQEFELYLISKWGGEPEQITFSPGFDGFPVFSPDGRWLVWASNRAAPESHETNLFIARWAD